MLDLEFKQPPVVARGYAGAIRNAVRRRSAGSLPDVARAQAAKTAIDRRRAANYNAVCGFGNDDIVAFTYPHVLAFGLHMAIMAHRDFPLSVLGLIHTHNRIRRYRHIRFDELLSFSVQIDNWRALDTGYEFDIDTWCYAYAPDVGVVGELVWTERSTMRAPERSGGYAQLSDKPLPELSWSTYEKWLMSADLGRRYARVSGDYNPIHLGAAPARMFGFKYPIATGMWLQARAVAVLEPYWDQAEAEASITFKKPVPLPAEREFVVDDHVVSGMSFGLIDRDSRAVHIRGSFGSLTDHSSPEYTEEQDNANS
ncbi:hypothetical protein HKX42_04035 [Salinisphaera sp. USBA-960]|uniref:MaoC/PaaZ C-terminal domain-containing protein n=1 Tax=Salinisphaera orenii TaxID=856731 RepID=UPI0013A68036|nr:hypothetical protein [Salifodinibacter halophilus]NNC26044.1 hypothetical protein [Salifodinibacter halophilus]